MRSFEVLVRVTVSCPGCAGYGCPACGRLGRVPASCGLCPEPAFYLRAGLPRCPACLYRCGICSETTPHDDRLPLPGGGPQDYAHLLCALVMAIVPEFLESAVLSDASFPTAAARARARASERTIGDQVPKPSDKLIQLMRTRGYIPTAEAMSLTGHSSSTLYEWVAQGKLKATRSGLFHFVELASLEACCPQAGAKRKEAAS